MIKDYLTELEIEKLEALTKDDVLMGALEKVMLQAIYTHGTIQKGFTPNPLENAAFNLASLAIANPIPDAELGANIRGMWAGVNYLKNAFDSLKGIRADKEAVLSEYNDAI